MHELVTMNEQGISPLSNIQFNPFYQAPDLSYALLSSSSIRPLLFLSPVS